MWTAIVVIVAISAFASVMRARLQGHHGVGDESTHKTPALRAPPNAELEREIADLRKRLAVLERIATDDRQSKAIAHEIEQLRDR
ncbi:MAG TPA: hypothetical protein VM055_02905 [Novosphingobium sp.]|nr:hypothetical protein [Novosphingobium sp.]